MGTGFSNSKTQTSEQGKEPEPTLERRQRVKNKVRAALVFSRMSRRPSLPPLNRDELFQFVDMLKNNQLQDYYAFKQDEATTSADKYRVRPKSGKRQRITRPTIEMMRECDSQCHLCHEATFEGFPCRVCSRTFHRVCLENCGRYKPGELSLLNNAHSNTGWSCYECDDIPRLLTDQEMKHLIEEFDRYDINRDAGITQDEFSRVRHDQHQQIENEAMSNEEEERTLLEFRLMDQDNDGIIDWWEFLKHEACKVLAKRDPMELVGLLKQKEVLVAKQLFSTFDDNGDGRISEYEVKKAYRHWFQHFDHICKPDDSSKRTGADTPALTLLRDSSSLNLHVEQQSSVLMSADTRNTGVITWDDFIKDQALYLICSRPNRSIFTCH